MFDLPLHVPNCGRLYGQAIYTNMNPELPATDQEQRFVFSKHRADL